MNTDKRNSHRTGFCGRWMLGLLFIVIAFTAFQSGSGAQLIGLPLLILLLCPLMHFFRHRGHARGRRRRENDRDGGSSGFKGRDQQ